MKALLLALPLIALSAPHAGAVGFPGELLAKLETTAGSRSFVLPGVGAGVDISQSANENNLVKRAIQRFGSAGALERECKEKQYGSTRDDACVAVDIVKRRIRLLTGENWKLAQAIAFTENRIGHDSAEVNMSVKSHADAKGLMQITKIIWNFYVNSTYANGKPRKDGHQVLGTAKDFDGQAPYGLNNSILVANAFLTDLKGRYCAKGDTAACRKLIAAAYNAGETAVTRAGNKVPNLKETRQYVTVFEQKYASAK